jgi:hypothetical protein
VDLSSGTGRGTGTTDGKVVVADVIDDGHDRSELT